MATTKASNPTRERLLAAAREEFSLHGVAGARVDRIAESAGVNKERIYGHFGSKDRLFDAVVAAALDEIAASTPLTEDGDPAEYVGRVYDFHRGDPTLLRLLLWEALHYRETPLPNEGERAEHYRRKAETLSRSLGKPVSPRVAATLLTLIGLAAWPIAVPQMARLIIGEPTDAPEFAVMMRAHLVEFARKALAAEGCQA